MNRMFSLPFPKCDFGKLSIQLGSGPGERNLPWESRAHTDGGGAESRHSKMIMTIVNEITSVNCNLGKPCNMRCGFRFATFRDIEPGMLPRGHLSGRTASRWWNS